MPNSERVEGPERAPVMGPKGTLIDTSIGCNLVRCRWCSMPEVCLLVWFVGQFPTE